MPEVKNEPQREFVCVSRKSFDVENMGMSALKGHSHMKAVGMDVEKVKSGILGYVVHPREKIETKTFTGTSALKPEDPDDAFNPEIL